MGMRFCEAALIHKLSERLGLLYLRMETVFNGIENTHVEWTISK